MKLYSLFSANYTTLRGYRVMVETYNMCNPTHQGPGKCIVLYRMSEYSGFVLAYRNNLGLWFLSDVKGCQIAQVPLYNQPQYH